MWVQWVINTRLMLWLYSMYLHQSEKYIHVMIYKYLWTKYMCLCLDYWDFCTYGMLSVCEWCMSYLDQCVYTSCTYGMLSICEWCMLYLDQCVYTRLKEVRLFVDIICMCICKWTHCIFIMLWSDKKMIWQYKRTFLFFLKISCIKSALNICFHTQSNNL